MEIAQVYKTIDTIIEAQKKARRNNDYITLLTNSEALLEHLPALINYQVDQEALYRKFEAKLADEFSGDKRNSSSYCETQAKATEYYTEWQRAKLFQELIYEMVALGKKLASSVDKEFNSI